jgi:hypothetical protein
MAQRCSSSAGIERQFLIQFEPDQHDCRLDRHSRKLRGRPRFRFAPAPACGESKVKLTDSMRGAEPLSADIQPETYSTDSGADGGNPSADMNHPPASAPELMATGDYRKARLVFADGREFAVTVSSRETGSDWSELEVRSPAFSPPRQSAETYSLRHERRRRRK